MTRARIARPVDAHYSLLQGARAPGNSRAMLRTDLKPMLLVALSGASYGFLGVFGTWIMEAGNSVTNLAFWRFACATLVLALMRPRQRLRVSSSSAVQATVSSLFYAVSSILYFMASQRIGTGLAMVIFYAYPIFVLLWGRAAGTQHMGPRSWACLLGVSGGLALIGDPTQGRFDGLGIAFGILSALGYAAYMLTIKRHAHRTEPLQGSLLLCFGCAVYAGMAASIDGTLALPSTWEVIASIVGLGAISTALPIALMQAGIKGISAAKASMISILEPVVTMLMGALFLRETMGVPQFVGVCGVLIAATYAAVLPEQAPKRKAAAAF